MQKLEDFGAYLRSRIEAEEKRLGFQLGWRLLASPLQVLDGAALAFIGLNPAGAVKRPDHPDLSVPSGNAYVNEIRERAKPAGCSGLQLQVRRLFTALGHAPETVLAGNFIPFRSQSRAQLRNFPAASAFGREIWADILARAKPPLIVSMGRDVFDNMSQVLGAGPASTVSVGWGTIYARNARFPGGRIIGLPHLSRFAIIGREESRQALAQLFPEGDFS